MPKKRPPRILKNKKSKETYFNIGNKKLVIKSDFSKNPNKLLSIIKILNKKYGKKRVPKQPKKLVEKLKLPELKPRMPVSVISNGTIPKDNPDKVFVPNDKVKNPGGGEGYFVSKPKPEQKIPTLPPPSAPNAAPPLPNASSSTAAAVSSAAPKWIIDPYGYDVQKSQTAQIQNAIKYTLQIDNEIFGFTTKELLQKFLKKNNLYIISTLDGAPLNPDDSDIKAFLKSLIKGLIDPNNIRANQVEPKNSLGAKIPLVNSLQIRDSTGNVGMLFGRGSNDNGLTETQINRMMKPFKKVGYRDCLAYDELGKLHFNKKYDKLGCIYNTDTRVGGSTTDDGHWRAIFIDPYDDKSIELYDSFGDPPDDQFYILLNKIVKPLKLPYLLKIKVNRIKEQSASTGNCGWFAMRFLINRFKGKNWVYSTGYDKSKLNEKQIKKFKKDFDRYI